MTLSGKLIHGFPGRFLSGLLAEPRWPFIKGAAGSRLRRLAGLGFRLMAVFLLPLTGLAPALAEIEAGIGGRPQAGAFKAVLAREPKSLDPHGPLDPAAWPVILVCYYRLMTLKNGLAEPVPALARTVRISDDGLKYTFVLHENFTFSDGQPLNPEAVLFSFDRLMSQETGRRHFAPLKRLEIIGPSTFALILDRPWPGFLNALASPPASLVSPGLAAQPEGYLRDHTLGAGRFVLEDWRPGQLTLAARVDLVNRPRLGRAVFHFEPDPEKRLKLFETLEAHLLQSPPEEASPPANFEARGLNSLAIRYLAFNQERAWNPEFKKELLTLIGRLHLGASLGAGPPPDLFPAGLYQGWTPQSGQDLKEALDIDILDGFFSEDPPPMLVLALEDPAEPQVALEARRLAEAMTKRGFPVRVERQTVVQLAEGGYDLFLGTKRPETGSPDEWLASLVMPGPDNRAFYKNILAESLVWEISASSQRRARVAKLNELAQMVYESQAYWPLYQVPLKVWADRRVKGYEPHPMWPEAIPLDSISLEVIRPAPPPPSPAPSGPAAPLADDPDPLGLDGLN